MVSVTEQRMGQGRALRSRGSASRSWSIAFMSAWAQEATLDAGPDADCLLRNYKLGSRTLDDTPVSSVTLVPVVPREATAPVPEQRVACPPARERNAPHKQPTATERHRLSIRQCSHMEDLSIGVPAQAA